ncbi:MAG: GNAT family N-acetyltransferase [Gemmatimonadetes bacterium]|nr:GNAT family N-acetyltransferase [Gemmatimonadota bacterium]
MLAGCTVRSWRRGDEPSVARHANNRKVWINLRDALPHPYTLDDAREWIDWVLAATPETHFAVDIDGQAVGAVGFVIQPDVHRVSAEIGFWLSEEFWGRGFMTQAVQAATEYALRTHGLHRVYATVFEWNAASMRVLEKAGYTREAVLRKSAIKDGRVIDQVLYGRTRG